MSKIAAYLAAVKTKAAAYVAKAEALYAAHPFLAGFVVGFVVGAVAARII